jgi:hypothetical protein
MKATLLKSLFYLLSVSSALGFAAYAVGQNSAPKSTPSLSSASSAESKIQIENWTKPEPGWLYVLDAKRDVSSVGGRVWLIDPESGKVMGSIRTGDNPDFCAFAGWKPPLCRVDHGARFQRAGGDRYGCGRDRAEEHAGRPRSGSCDSSIFNHGGFPRWPGAANRERHA